MAKPKQKVLVEVTSRIIPEPIAVWVDNPGEALQDILGIEGILQGRAVIGGPIRVTVDPRYDTEEIAGEIRELLNAEVPDVFRGE